jgi:hypothetical protein
VKADDAYAQTLNILERVEKFWRSDAV